jgi:hypothetical protein
MLRLLLSPKLIRTPALPLQILMRLRLSSPNDDLQKLKYVPPPNEYHPRTEVGVTKALLNDHGQGISQGISIMVFHLYQQLHRSP